ncbi:ureidoglycolate lyase [Poseidonibacter antarcticus]|uniref:ureidoglycolate lyase n=1 Tax=Poseidonibacter antarcticus TaxID=2478538 RepID=UPI000EF4C271|nr:ureidoglycolate lyase [Poseidonibacter antarcticus]
MRTISPISLEDEEFSKYGKIISVDNSDSIVINNGFASKHYNLCNIDANDNGGVATLHLYEGKKREFPLKINMMEKHPHFSQTFIPRSKTPFIIVVALGAKEPDLNTLSVFKSNGNQGVHYNKNVWHFPLISLEDNEQFIVVDRNDLGKEENKIIDCIELELNQDIEILKD